MSQAEKKQQQDAEAEAEAEAGAAEARAEAQAQASVFGIEDRAEALEAELKEAKEQMLRALADAENTRRRLQRDKDEAVKYAAAGFAKSVLSVADNLRRALESVDPASAEPAAAKTLHEGVALVERELMGAFERAGIRRLEPMGEKLDPNFHEAMFEVPGTGQPDGTIVQVLQPGYVMQDRLLRPAMVGVAKGGGEGAKGGKVDETA